MATAGIPTAGNLENTEGGSELLHLFATLSLQDIDEIQVNRKGKSRHDVPLTDEELAFQLYTEEANSLLAFASDAILARSVDNALRTDRALIRQMVATENIAFRDRQYALALSQGRTPPPSTPPPAASTQSRATSSAGIPASHPIVAPS